eukprot:gene28093-31201_t
MHLRLLCGISECHLRSRKEEAVPLAKEAASHALEWAAIQGGCDQTLVHRQLARVHAANLDGESAHLACTVASRSGNPEAVYDLAGLWLSDMQSAAETGSAVGQQAIPSSILSQLTTSFEALKTDNSASGRAMGGAILLLTALLHAEQGALQGAKQMVINSMDELPQASQPAAYAIHALLALRQHERGGAAGAADSGEEAAKKLVLEARWAISTALRLLPKSSAASNVGGAASQASYWLLLARAELARGRADKAAEALHQVARMWPEPFPPPSVSMHLAKAVQGGTEDYAHQLKRRLLARTVHAYPACSAAWKMLKDLQRSLEDAERLCVKADMAAMLELNNALSLAQRVASTMS